MPEGAADTTTNFVFTNFVLLSTEAPALPVQQDMILIRLLHRITSCHPEADDFTAFLCPNTRQTQTVTETAQRRFATHTTSIVLSRGETTSPTFSHLPIRLPRSWHRPLQLNLRVMELFGLSCHVLCRGLEEAMWWHSAAKHVPVVSAPLRLRTQSVQFGSDTINLRTTSAHTAKQVDDTNSSDDFPK